MNIPDHLYTNSLARSTLMQIQFIPSIFAASMIRASNIYSQCLTVYEDKTFSLVAI